MFIDVATFGAQADACAKYLTKGRAVAVTGRLVYREWDDNGTRRSRHHIVGRVQFGGKPDNPTPTKDTTPGGRHLLTNPSAGTPAAGATPPITPRGSQMTALQRRRPQPLNPQQSPGSATSPSIRPQVTAHRAQGPRPAPGGQPPCSVPSPRRRRARPRWDICSPLRMSCNRHVIPRGAPQQPGQTPAPPNPETHR